MVDDNLSDRLRDLVYPTFQCIVDSSGRPLYNEACCRCFADKRADAHVSFLNTAELVGFIDLVDHVIAEKSIAQAMDAGVPLGVNVSVFTIERNGDSYLRLISGARRLPGGLIIEITETIESHNFSMLMEFVRRARSMGARIALDDFGTGSFTDDCIRMLRPNFVKLAMSRVHHAMSNESGRKWVLDAVAISKSVGAGVIAEGIETEIQKSMMERFGVSFFQGYLLSMPNHLLARAGFDNSQVLRALPDNVTPLYRSEAL